MSSTLRPDAPHYLEFVYLPSYVRTAEGLFDDEAERRVEQTLLADPHAGDTIANAGGVRKLRVKLPGRGKSGGARVIYFYRSAAGRIYLILAYAKSARESISANHKKAMRQLTRILEDEH